MDYNWTSPQLGTSGTVIVQPDLSQGYNYMTLMRQTQLVCNSPDSLLDETDYKHNYNMAFVRRNTHSNTDPVLNINSGPVMTATIRYIRGTTETIARTLLCILQPYNIHVAHNLITTIWRLLTNVKDEDKVEDRQGRPESDGWSTDNIQPDCELSWSKSRLAGHFALVIFG